MSVASVTNMRYANRTMFPQLSTQTPTLQGRHQEKSFVFFQALPKRGGGEAQWANLDKSKSIQFYQTNVTNVAKILLLQVFLNIRRKLFDFQTFMNQTHIINSTDIIIYFADTYYLYYEKQCEKRRIFSLAERGGPPPPLNGQNQLKRF